MARFVDDAIAALNRWRQMNMDAPPPPVKVLLRNGDEYEFNGLAASPAGQSPESVALSATGIPLPILVVRDEDIARIEIGATTAQPLGFNPGGTPVR